MITPDHMIKTIDAQIRKIGMQAVLRRSGMPDRPCWMFFGQWTSKELYGGLVNAMDRLVIMSPVGLTIPPDHHKDTLVTWVQPYDPLNPAEHERLAIQRAPERVAPLGNVVICWRLAVRR